MGQRKKLKTAKAALINTIQREVSHLQNLFGVEAANDVASRLGYEVEQALKQFVTNESDGSENEEYEDDDMEIEANNEVQTLASEGTETEAEQEQGKRPKLDQIENGNETGFIKVVHKIRRKAAEKAPPTLPPTTAATRSAATTSAATTSAAKTTSGAGKTQGAETTAPKKTPQTKDARPGSLQPPIVCFKMSTSCMYRHFKLTATKVNYTIVNVNRTKTIIKTPTKADHQEIMKYLQAQKVQHHTYTAKEDRKCMLLLKKIHFSHQPEDIIQELSTNGFKALKVSPFRSKRDKSAIFNAFVVEFEKGTDLINISRTKQLLGEAIKWEKIEPEDLTQCKNCQHLGHVSINCFLPYRCVKCSEQHERGQCKRTDPTVGKPYCVLCKTEGHPASYAGCPYKKKVLAEKKEKQAVRTARKVTPSYTKASFYNGNPTTEDRYLQVLSIMDPSFEISANDSFGNFFVTAVQQYNRG